MYRGAMWRAGPSARVKECLEQGLSGASIVGLREDQESWECFPLPARQSDLTAAGLSRPGGGWVHREIPWG